MLKLVTWVPKSQTGEAWVKQDIWACVQHVLVNNAREQARFGESKEDTDADELLIPDVDVPPFELYNVVCSTYVLTKPMDNLKKSRVSIDGLGMGDTSTHITIPHKT